MLLIVYVRKSKKLEHNPRRHNPRRRVVGEVGVLILVGLLILLEV